MNYPEDCIRITETAAQSRYPSYLLENSILGFDHCLIGGMIASSWNLGPVLNDSLSHHHHPESALEENRRLTAMIAIGNLFANTLMADAPAAEGLENRISNELLDQVGLNWNVLTDQVDVILEEIEKAKIFLKV